MRIADVLRNKGSAVVTVESRASVAELVAALAEHNVGAMVVLGPEGIAGIVSERDVVRRLHDRGGDLLAAPVSEIMTSEVFTCTPRDSVDSLTVLMTERRIRHVPVVDGGELVGIVSIGDVVKSRISQLQEDHDQLTAYIAQG
ncbi:CBS domain protein [Saccharothrix saharensis]|uniref:CBS domain protein n=1 Tax=Saccharothrix saharensis TaxID=571190 RepID=A0A543JBV3_9PSEU|nr:CBS domain-containing protein [Saccharothrix saharensis]TQM80254.1 CBS domain protein [Saccharothrix saharensis]